MSYFQKRGLTRVDQQFLAGGSFSNWLQLLRVHGGIDLRYLARSAYVSAIALLGVPFRMYENAKFGAAIEDTRIDKAPIFIVGHWRSGTTYVHQLLGQNPDFAIVTFLHTMIPGLFLTGKVFKAILSSSVPETRPMDNVRLGPNVAEEEEYALGNMGPYSFYHALSFPREMREIFDRYVLFEDVDPSVIERWKVIYRRFLKKVTFSSGGKRLLLKNPANTGRIRTILEMFPDAKFVHVYRNPYVVYSSTMNWLDKELVPTALQDVDEALIRENALINYEKLMQRYLEDQALIPPGNLVEVKFEAVEAHPYEETARIYRELGLDFDAETEENVRQLIASVREYQKNTYTLERGVRQELSRRWGFAIRRWHYTPPRP
jgi:hypothetical protein